MKYALSIVAVMVTTPVLASTDISHSEFFSRSSSGNWTQPIAHETFTPEAPRYTRKRIVTRNKKVRYITVEIRPNVQIVRTRSNLQKQAVADMVARETAARLGAQWVPTALKLAKIESSFNCGAVGPRTRHGNARGVLQVMPGSARALGYDPRRLNECQYGIIVGLAHFQKCIQSGVRTHGEMAACHVSGWGSFNKKLNRQAEKYRRSYVRMAQI